MNFLRFLSVNKKRLIGTSLLLSLLAVQSVGATGTLSEEIKSRGNIDYDADSDGESDVLFYSDDLKAVANGIDDLNSNVATLQQALTSLGDQTSEYKTQIISGLNGNVYAKDNIDSSATFAQIIEKIENIPAPTEAIGNTWTGGDNAGLGITADNTSVNIDGVTDLSLAVNESITLPSGYYPNDITIKNNVANRGSLMFNPSAKIEQNVEAGYYDGGSLDSTNAYNLGYTDGLAAKDSEDVSVVYTVNHVHTSKPGACWSATTTYGTHGWVDRGDEPQCQYCGMWRASYIANHGNVYGMYTETCSSHRITTYSLSCGKDEGIRDVTDVSTIVIGDSVISATITY